MSEGQRPKYVIDIIKVHKLIHERHAAQNWVWKRLHQAKMFVCNHDSLEPSERGELSYWSGVSYVECHNCEALCEIKERSSDEGGR